MPFSTKNGGSLGEESVFAGFFEFEIDSACCLYNAWIWMCVCVCVCVRMRHYVAQSHHPYTYVSLRVLTCVFVDVE